MAAISQSVEARQIRLSPDGFQGKVHKPDAIDTASLIAPMKPEANAKEGFCRFCKGRCLRIQAELAG